MPGQVRIYNYGLFSLEYGNFSNFNQLISMMVKATENDKDLAIDLLTSAFTENKSVNYIVRQDHLREQRIKALMQYSFDCCMLYGHVYFSEDKKACALVSFPDRKKTSFKSIILDLKFIFNSAGVANVSKILHREKLISGKYPKTEIYYLWFIGVSPEHQNQGIGRTLLAGIINEANQLNRPVYLETSTESNVRWYQKAGFEIYGVLDFGYNLFLLRRAPGSIS